MQIRAMRIIIDSMWNLQTNPIFLILRVRTLCSTNTLTTGCFIFKVNSSLLPSNSIVMFLTNINNPDHNTRNKLNFHVNPHSLVVREHNN